MKITSISNFRKDIKRYVDEIDQDQEPLVVTRGDNVSVVVIPLDTFNSYSETEYLLRSPANARRLLKSVENARAGNVDAHDLIEE
ncbi:MAG TPA: type II toxin-antitoxin system Phd/YefM family antitoxin [Patescibacteria group bacterium]|jgi:antitoxin YefM|nr:type II toxin-antitoxin system Phd/YefM family antitoxin [Patescibacteria group bacterium]